MARDWIEELRESEDSDRRFVIVFKDRHLLKEWDIWPGVVINDDVAYMQDLIGKMPVQMKNYLISFINLFLRAIEDSQNENDGNE